MNPSHSLKKEMKKNQHLEKIRKRIPETTNESQNRTVLNWLKSGNAITAYVAANYYGIYRLSARVYDLKKQGHNIVSKLEFEGSKHWSVYKLKKS